MDALTRYLEQQLQLPQEEAHALLRHWQKPKTLKRGGFLTRQGQVENHLYYIQEGTMGIFYDIEENEQVVGFGYADTLICSFPSFIRNYPSDYYIQALSTTELIGIARSDFYRLLGEYSRIEHLWLQMLEEALLGRIEREIDLLTVSPRERIQRLLNRSPHIFQLIPNKYIASYLRMTPETLSRNMK
ncbi:MAG: Crp/Fnr family transcriptional regulator [Phaeodactylibacter sp.]|nr:Crp/Fnr family transcriptional regulator [Phaeodactylibacter sp.]MCB9274014.1 Crp/Fnr family transcriptional regulator [Lewinellaceae bacterium]